MTETTTVRNPLFARLYTRLARNETAEETEFRRRLLAGVGGQVIEVGAGSGANFAHYGADVTQVLAVEPEPYLRKQATKAATEAPVAIEVREGTADDLPAASGEFDAAVVSLVLCTVPDPARALAEAKRVLRVGGELRFYEHVISHKASMARLQKVFDRTFWPHVAGGCHCARDTASAIEAAGFTIESCDRESFAPSPLVPPFPHIVGLARPVDG
jgi:ubiquinone/menaquinone biosynthesis C-methylase UbiE